MVPNGSRYRESSCSNSVGAAILAGVGSGVFANAAEGYLCMAIPERVIYPNPDSVKMYQKQKEAYQKYANLLGAMDTNV